MIKYRLHDLVTMLTALNYAQRDLGHVKPGTNEELDETRLKALGAVLDGTAICCRNFNADPSLIEQIETLKMSISNDPKSQRAIVLKTQLNTISMCVENNLSLRVFMFIPSEDAQRYDNNRLFGEEVSNAFPDIIPDMIQAGNCLACDNNTAAVFHLMRIVEWGLRALCVHFGFQKAKSVKKSGKVELTPIEYLDWERMLNQLQSKVDGKIAKLQRGAVKQRLQEFYHPVLQDIKAIRDAWRNHVMHTRAVYMRADALAVLSHVHGLMLALAKRGIKQL